MENHPQILHLSARESRPDNEYRWLYVNIVFRVTDEHDTIACQGRADEWVKTLIYEVDDPSEIDNHYLNTKHSFEEIPGTSLSKLVSACTDPEYDISSKMRSGLSMNHHNTLRYIEKFNVFVFRDYVEDNFVTRAALSMLEDVKNGKQTTSRFVPFSTFIRCVDTLHTFWD